MTDRSLPPLHVLVAEDDAAMRELIASELELEGCRVSEAASGWDLIASVAGLMQDPEAPPIDLIIADVRMPGPGGLQVLAVLRASLHPPPPMILITAFGDAELHHEALRLGAAAFLDKPFDFDELRAAVRNLAALRFAGGRAAR